jgi:ubiquinone/menaquinone biosynthesis C-methylase UbiE
VELPILRSIGNWAVLPKATAPAICSVFDMTPPPHTPPAKRRPFPLLEEGAAFSALEGRLFECSRPRVHSMARFREDPIMKVDNETNAVIHPNESDGEHVATAEAWDAIADGYDTFVAPGEATFATEALRLAGLEAGHRFLDVAAGTGGLSLPAARLGAKVVAIDWARRMLERFEARVRQEGLSDCESKLMDCHDLTFEDGTFDVTGSQFGVMLVPDQAKALREMVRVTKAGGKVLVIAYGSPDKFEVLQVFIAALAHVAPGFSGLPEPPPLEFQASDPSVLQRRLTDAGLRDVTVDTTREERIELRSGQELWDWCLGGNPIPNMLVADLGREQQAAMREYIDAALRPRMNDRGVAVLTAALNIGIGAKPAK